jgi:hypothetical protein
MFLLRKLFNISLVPPELRAQLESEGLIHLVEKVGVSQRFSGSVPGLFSAASAHRGSGTLALTRHRVYASLPTAPRLKVPAIDAPWDGDGLAKVTISADGVQMDLDVKRVDPRFNGHLSLRYKASLGDEVLAQLPATSLSFGVSPEYVFHILGVRAKA